MFWVTDCHRSDPKSYGCGRKQYRVKNRFRKLARITKESAILTRRYQRCKMAGFDMLSFGDCIYEN